MTFFLGEGRGDFLPQRFDLGGEGRALRDCGQERGNAAPHSHPQAVWQLISLCQLREVGILKGFGKHSRYF